MLIRMLLRMISGVAELVMVTLSGVMVGHIVLISSIELIVSFILDCGCVWKR